VFSTLNRKESPIHIDVRTDDARMFLAILFTSGYVVLPARRMNWECSRDAQNEAIGQAMPRNRFEEILRYFHVDNNNNLDPSDKYTKVKTSCHRTQ